MKIFIAAIFVECLLFVHGESSEFLPEIKDDSWEEELTIVYQPGNKGLNESVEDEASPNLEGINWEDRHKTEAQLELDTSFSTCDVIKNDKYICEKHELYTWDGYILEIHRIPRHQSQTKDNKGPPVLLWHGFLSNSIVFVSNGPKLSLGYYLVEHGYDVWLGNFRGNRYSRDHEILTRNDSSYWDFSIDELGRYDIPETIDYILSKTKKEKLHFIGFDLGATAGFVMAHHRPGHIKKLLSFQAIAPTVYLENIESFMITALLGLISRDRYDGLAEVIGRHEIIPNDLLYRIIGQRHCIRYARKSKCCDHLESFYNGIDSRSDSTSLYPSVYSHQPPEGSAKLLTHILQLARCGNFTRFDYGCLTNKARYGSETPPAYKISNAMVKTAIHYSDSDKVSTPHDVNKLYEKLPNKFGLFKIKCPKFSHIDFTFGLSGRRAYFENIIDVLSAK